MFRHLSPTAAIWPPCSNTTTESLHSCPYTLSSLASTTSVPRHESSSPPSSMRGPGRGSHPKIPKREHGAIAMPHEQDNKVYCSYRPKHPFLLIILYSESKLFLGQMQSVGSSLSSTNKQGNLLLQEQSTHSASRDKGKKLIKEETGDTHDTEVYNTPTFSNQNHVPVHWLAKSDSKYPTAMPIA